MTDSLQARLGIATVLVAIIFLFASALVLDGAFSASGRLAMQERMLGQLYVLLSVMRLDADGRPVMPPPPELPEPALAIGDSGLYGFIAAGQGILWRSPSMESRDLPVIPTVSPGERIWRDLQLTDGQDYALLGFGLSKNTHGAHPFGVYLLAELAPLQREIAVYRKRLWLGLLAVAAVLIAAQICVLRWSLRPLRHIAAELRAIEAGTLQRIEGRYPTEIRQLTVNLNLLLQQERARQTRYRNALTDLAHSLKTSLAVLKGAVDHPDTLPANVTEQSARMTMIVERQLQRAATLGHGTSVANLAARPVIERVLASLGKVYRNKGVDAVNRVAPDLRFRGDEADLFELLGNLLDNAYKWSVERVEIEGFRTASGGLIFAVHDDGPGFNPGSLDRIMERGVRADENAPGHGIGLAMVGDIVDGYGGEVRLGTSLLGGALIVVELAA